MYTLSALRARVRALQRKMALELAVVRLRRLAGEYCLQSSAARRDNQPSPDPLAFIRRVAAAGFRLPSFMVAHNYLQRCRDNNALPDTEDLLRAFLPWSHRYPPPRFQ